jgi:O-Antigen ligase
MISNIHRKGLVLLVCISAPLLAVILGLAGTVKPLVLEGVGAVLVVSAFTCGLLGHRRALALCPAILLVAGTKFRTRDPLALVSGNIDSQILFELFLYAVVGLVTLASLISEERIDNPTPCEFLLLAYSILALSSVAWSYTPAITGVRGIQQCIVFFMSFVAVRRIGAQTMVRMLGETLLFYVILCSALAVFVPSLNGTIPDPLSGVPRFSWLAVTPGCAATEAGIAAAFVAAEALFGGAGWRKRMAQIPLWLLFLSLMVVVAATRTRIPLLASGVAIASLYAIKFRQDLSALLPKILALALPCALCLLFYSPMISGFILRGEDAQDVTALSGRVDLWKGIAVMVAERPLFGYGFVGTRQLLLQVLSWAGEAHNALAESLLDLGVIGASLLWVSVFRGIALSIKRATWQAATRSTTEAFIASTLVLELIISTTNAAFTDYLSYDATVMVMLLIALDALNKQSYVLAGQSSLCATNGTHPRPERHRGIERTRNGFGHTRALSSYATVRSGKTAKR